MEEAKSFLSTLLAAGSVESDRVWSDARMLGISDSTLKRAKQELRIGGVRRGGFGAAGWWEWALPGSPSQAPRNEQAAEPDPETRQRDGEDLRDSSEPKESTPRTEPLSDPVNSLDDAGTAVASAPLSFRTPGELTAAIFAVVHEAAGEPLTDRQIATKAGTTTGAVDTFLAGEVDNGTATCAGGYGKARTYALTKDEAVS